MGALQRTMQTRSTQVPTNSATFRCNGANVRPHFLARTSTERKMQQHTSAMASKTIEKARALIDSGSHYEAQQMLKTVYHRQRARKQVQDSYAVLKDGAVLQLQQAQVTCGVELGLMLVEAFTLDKPTADVALPFLLEIIASFPAPAASDAGLSTSGNDTRLDEEGRLIAASVKWAHKQSLPEAARQLQDAFAWHVWQAYGWRYMGRATRHFVHGGDAERFASALHACSSQAPDSEADLFICRATFQVLAAASGPSMTQRQLQYASQLLQACRSRSPALDSPLLHFTELLLQALQRKSKALTTLLKQRYQQSFARDSVLGAYLSHVERVYLGVGGGGGMGGLLGSLLKSLTDMDEDDDEE